MNEQNRSGGSGGSPRRSFGSRGPGFSGGSGGDRPSFGGGNRPPRGNRPMRGGSSGGGPRGGGRSGPRKVPPPPMLMGEPSPSLAKINGMNIAQLTAKLLSLDEEIARVTAKLGRLESQDVKPEDKIKVVNDLIARLKALKIITEKRLAEKAQRKAAYDARQQQQP